MPPASQGTTASTAAPAERPDRLPAATAGRGPQSAERPVTAVEHSVSGAASGRPEEHAKPPAPPVAAPPLSPTLPRFPERPTVAAPAPVQAPRSAPAQAPAQAPVQPQPQPQPQVQVQVQPQPQPQPQVQASRPPQAPSAWKGLLAVSSRVAPMMLRVAARRSLGNRSQKRQSMRGPRRCHSAQWHPPAMPSRRRRRPMGVSRALNARARRVGSRARGAAVAVDGASSCRVGRTDEGQRRKRGSRDRPERYGQERSTQRYKLSRVGCMTRVPRRYQCD
jgi:hypothetical protein